MDPYMPLGLLGLLAVRRSRMRCVAADQRPCCGVCGGPQSMEIKSGMDIFNIVQPQYKDLAAMEKDLDFMDRIWGMKSEWEGLYSGWKDGSFAEIRVSAGNIEVRGTGAYCAAQACYTRPAACGACI